MKGIQVGETEELDKLYFLRKQGISKKSSITKRALKGASKRADKPLIMTLNWNHGLFHSN